MSTNQKLSMSLDEIGKMNRRSYHNRRGFRNSYRNNRQNQYNNAPSSKFSNRRRSNYSNQYKSRSLTRGRFHQKNYISSVYRRNSERRRPFNQRRRNSNASNRQVKKEGAENKTRLFVSNLHSSIVNTELKKIFENIGVLKRCGIRWDKLGNSLGTADVEYDSPQDAAKAVQCFNNAEIDGTIMKVEYSSESNAQKKSSAPKRIFKKRLGFRNRRRQ